MSQNTSAGERDELVAALAERAEVAEERGEGAEEAAGAAIAEADMLRGQLAECRC